LVYIKTQKDYVTSVGAVVSSAGGRCGNAQYFPFPSTNPNRTGKAKEKSGGIWVDRDFARPFKKCSSYAYVSSSSKKYSSREIPADFRLFLIMKTGTSS
jgi:hypothetical protein